MVDHLQRVAKLFSLKQRKASNNDINPLPISENDARNSKAIFPKRTHDVLVNIILAEKVTQRRRLFGTLDLRTFIDMCANPVFRIDVRLYHFFSRNQE